ncbi:hypothetical protein [Aestuariimicrobium kwangyangense]|uniref:hypothetical protein n=1 Tax=Aestuariimicrobium kwangyangense TaxID=396389 RepID=UPI00047CE023|nr:hypothetical protein [Aestuariimicrobium kwangyangense]
MTAAATTLAPVLPRPRVRGRADRRLSTGPRPTGPRLHRPLASAPTASPLSARACTLPTAARVGGRSLAVVERVQITERGLALLLGSLACLVVLSLAVVVNTFLGFSNAPLG